MNVFENEDSVPNSSKNNSQSLGDCVKIKELHIAYYCEKCKISTFYSTDKKCAVCGYNFGYMIR